MYGSRQSLRTYGDYVRTGQHETLSAKDINRGWGGINHQCFIWHLAFIQLLSQPEANVEVTRLRALWQIPTFDQRHRDDRRPQLALPQRV